MPAKRPCVVITIEGRPPPRRKPQGRHPQWSVKGASCPNHRYSRTRSPFGYRRSSHEVQIVVPVQSAAATERLLVRSRRPLAGLKGNVQVLSYQARPEKSEADTTSRSKSLPRSMAIAVFAPHLASLIIIGSTEKFPPPNFQNHPTVSINRSGKITSKCIPSSSAHK